MAVVGRLVDHIRRLAQEARQAEEVKRQGAAIRGWDRFEATLGRMLGYDFPTPGQLNPEGFDYEVARNQRPGLRPNIFVRQREAFRAPIPAPRPEDFDISPGPLSVEPGPQPFELPSFLAPQEPDILEQQRLNFAMPSFQEEDWQAGLPGAFTPGPMSAAPEEPEPEPDVSGLLGRFPQEPLQALAEGFGGGDRAREFFEAVPTELQQQLLTRGLEGRLPPSLYESLIMREDVPPETREMFWPGLQEAGRQRREQAPALGLLEAPFIAAGTGAEAVAEDLGAPPWAQMAANIGT